MHRDLLAFHHLAPRVMVCVLTVLCSACVRAAHGDAGATLNLPDGSKSVDHGNFGIKGNLLPAVCGVCCLRWHVCMCHHVYQSASTTLPAALAAVLGLG